MLGLVEATRLNSCLAGVLRVHPIKLVTPAQFVITVQVVRLHLSVVIHNLLLKLALCHI